MKKISLVIIDGQNDFCDLPEEFWPLQIGNEPRVQPALPVTGAHQDMIRLAAFIDKHGSRLDRIICTMDSHMTLHIAHPAFWRDKNGKMPTPYTVITNADVKSGIWIPIMPNVRPAELNGKSILEHCLDYTAHLEATGKYVLTIWPPHCRIGTWGHNIHPILRAALTRWEIKYQATVDFVTKGVCIYTENYGALQAEFVLPNDPSTGLNGGFLNLLVDTDEILLGGQASSHCVLTTGDQVEANISSDQLGKIWLLTDAMSPVGAIPGYDFPKIAADWMKAKEAKGMHLTTTETMFS